SSGTVSGRATAITCAQRASMAVTPVSFASTLARRAADNADRPTRISTSRGSDRRGDTWNRWARVGDERRAGHQLEARDVAPRCLEPNFVGHRGRRAITRPLRLVREPAAHVLLVQRTRFLAPREPLLVVVRVPVPRRVRGVDLVDHGEV